MGTREKEEESDWWARGIAIHTKSIPFVPLTAPAPPSPRATDRLSLCASSPNFVANLRATKSAPFDFTLIRCQCRAIDEANTPLYRVGYRRGFHFPRSVPFLPRQAGLFQGNFPSLFASILVPSLVPVFLYVLPFFRPSILLVVRFVSLCFSLSLSLSLFPHPFFTLSRACLS